jgi:hypothetical protein
MKKLLYGVILTWAVSVTVAAFSGRTTASPEPTLSPNNRVAVGFDALAYPHFETAGYPQYADPKRPWRARIEDRRGPLE